MGLSCARQDDIVFGICYHPSHSSPIQYVGVIIGGAAITKINNLNAAQESNIVIGFCGHNATIVTSSSTTKIEGLGAAREFDLVVGECIVANIMTGSGNVFTT
jgi:uncharacterized Zn-binding protein involved in type VI secretion